MALWMSTSNLAPGTTSQAVTVPPGFYNFIVRRDPFALNASGTDFAINSDTTTTLQQLGTDGATWQTIATVSNASMAKGQGIVHVEVNPAPWGAVQVVGGAQLVQWCGLTDDNGNESRTIW
jgi:hypothetical protein